MLIALLPINELVRSFSAKMYVRLIILSVAVVLATVAIFTPEPIVHIHRLPIVLIPATLIVRTVVGISLVGLLRLRLTVLSGTLAKLWATLARLLVSFTRLWVSLAKLRVSLVELRIVLTALIILTVLVGLAVTVPLVLGAVLRIVLATVEGLLLVVEWQLVVRTRPVLVVVAIGIVGVVLGRR